MKSILLTLLCAMVLFGQDSVSRIVKLKHADPDSLFSVLATLAGKQVRWHSDARLGIVAMNGPANQLDAFESEIQKLDVPAPPEKPEKNVELTFHILLGSAQVEITSVPPDLSGVATQLRNVFGFKSVRVLETTVLRGRERRPMEAKGVVTAASKLAETAPYEITVKAVTLTVREKGAAVRLDGLRFNTQFPVGTPSAIQFRPVAMNTDLDVREGQKVVVGKASIDGAAQSIFLVVTAKVVD